MKTKKPTQIILASSSIYREALLAKLRIEFNCYKPQIDEARIVGESPREMAARLSKEKALTAARVKKGIIIASDQVITPDDPDCADARVYGKPESNEDALDQLRQASGSSMTALTGLAVYHTEKKELKLCVETAKVELRTLKEKQIKQYLKKDKPYYCAGSIKSESLGIALCKKIEANDPNTLVGLPLIRLIDFLEAFDIDVLTL